MRSLAALAVIPFFACNAGSKTTSADATPLRVSMIPTTDPAKILRESEPLKSRLGQATGATVDFTIPSSYSAVVEALVADKLDVAHLGGFTYVQARKRVGVVPLVQRDRDQAFHSVFVVPVASTIATLADLKGHTFAFGDVNSTSGHLMPEYYMRQNHVDPEVLAKAIYTGGHDATLLAVANGKVDAGAMDEAVFQKMTADGKVDAKSVKIFYTTPPFFDYVWVARKGLPAETQKKIAAVFLALDESKPEDKKLLDLLSGKKYLPADDGSYDKLREAATQAGLLK
jgi:phosphonate transport system substrate-binding protein